MDSYGSIDGAWTAIVRQLLEQPAGSSRDGDAREIIGYAFRLDASQQMTLLMNARRCVSPSYAAAETLWYLSRTDNIEMMRSYARQYARFSDDGTTANGAYGARLARNVPGHDQLKLARDTILRAPMTRQAVISLWRSEDLLTARDGTSKDIPCTVCVQFLLRNGKLHCCAYMRSNDIWLGTPYDVFAFTCVQRYLAYELGCEIGDYVHCVGSMHLYERNAEAASQIFDKSSCAPSGNRWAPAYTESISESLEAALNAERTMRTSESVDDLTLPKDQMMYDLACACGRVWRNKSYGFFSPDFAAATLQHETRFMR